MLQDSSVGFMRVKVLRKSFGMHSSDHWGQKHRKDSLYSL